MRINLGYVLNGANGDRDVPDAPLPDFLVCGTNYCTQLVNWFENLSKELHIPLFMLDMPFIHDDDLGHSRLEYIKAQFARLIRQLEEMTGRRFDQDRFMEISNISLENVRLWKKAFELVRHVPAPADGFDFYNYMMPMVVMRGRRETGEILAAWIDEMQKKIAKGEGPFKDSAEKYRIFFDGVICWPQLAHVSKALRSYGINITGSNYPISWALEYEAGDMASMARAYAQLIPNCNLEGQVARKVAIIREFKCEGIVYHMNRSCKVMDFLMYEVQRRIHAETGLPYITFDGDQGDPRVFVPAHFDTRIQALVEMMDQAKISKGRKS